jgi:hypothetical protein
VAEQVVDRQEGEKARELLQRAQAGDGKARAELFRFHPRYAKGILAIMAAEGGALALKVLSTHGLSEAMIQKSSPKIVKRYLMKKFGEDDTPPSWTGALETAQSALQAVSDKVQALDRLFDRLADHVLARLDPNQMVQVQASLSLMAGDLVSQADVGAATAAFRDVRVQRDLLARRDDAQQDDLTALDAALDAEAKKVGELREAVSTSMDRLRTVMRSIDARPATDPLREKARAAAGRVLVLHASRLEALAQVG